MNVDNEDNDIDMITFNNINNNNYGSLFKAKTKKYYCIIFSLYLISIMILILNIIIILLMYYTYMGVQTSIGDLKNYINNSVPSIKEYLDNYTLKISLA